MAESARLVDLVQAGIDDFLDDRAPQITAIAPELATFIEYSRDLLRGGKRFRALFCYWGWQAVYGRGAESTASDFGAVVSVASALEVFHAAALVHDDIMDNSDTRRGQPAAHKRFEALHAADHWAGSPQNFGRSGALLLGDLLLDWSDEIFDNGLRQLSLPASATAARREFNTMRTEVTLGQYLDIVEEQSWRTHPETEHLGRAHKVIVYKSAKYSVEAPLAIGASLGGASLGQVAALRDYGIPLGTAYQLRDDLLGVFGDAEKTGKPSGDDLREGKRTVLIALARTKLPSNGRALLDELLGDSELTNQQVGMLQASIRDSGAVEHVERIIDHNVKLAIGAIADAPLSASAREELIALADRVVRRAS
ncbi:MAG: polyprenyl synthetase family protein [Lacisediminihabitans sp.]